MVCSNGRYFEARRYHLTARGIALAPELSTVGRLRSGSSYLDEDRFSTIWFHPLDRFSVFLAASGRHI